MVKKRPPSIPPRLKQYRDDRPYGHGPDMFEPNNQPNHNHLGHGVRQDNQLAWLILIGIILLALILS